MSRCFRWSSFLLLLVAAAGCGSRQAVDRPPNLQHALKIREVLDTGGAAAAEGPTLTEPTGWATLRGTFTFVGNPPALAQLRIDKDQATCAPGGKPVYDEDVIVGPAGGLANVLVFLSTSIPTDDPQWIHPEYEATQDALLTDRPFDQKNCVFLSRVYALRSTQTVPILNSDPVGHNAKIDAPSGVKPINESIAAGGRPIDYKPGGEAAQPFPVSCTIHPWMRAWMISRNNPYFAVTGEDGSFEIRNLPAGEGLKLEFRVWQERAKFVENVTLNGQRVTWRKGRFELELVPDETNTIEVALDASALSK